MCSHIFLLMDMTIFNLLPLQTMLYWKSLYMFLFKQKKKIISTHTLSLLPHVFIASFPIIIPAELAHRILLRAQCDNRGQSDLENVKTWHVIVTVSKLELAWLGCLCQPSAHTAHPPPIHVVLLFWSQQLLPTQRMWAELARGLILLCHTQDNGKYR